MKLSKIRRTLARRTWVKTGLYTVNAAGSLATVQKRPNAQSSWQWVLGITYDEYGRMIYQDHAYSTYGLRVRYAYTAADEVSQIKRLALGPGSPDPSEDEVWRQEYVRDELRRVAQVKEPERFPDGGQHHRLHLRLSGSVDGGGSDRFQRLQCRVCV